MEELGFLGDFWGHDTVLFIDTTSLYAMHIIIARMK